VVLDKTARPFLFFYRS